MKSQPYEGRGRALAPTEEELCGGQCPWGSGRTERWSVAGWAKHKSPGMLARAGHAVPVKGHEVNCSGFADSTLPVGSAPVYVDRESSHRR